MTPIKARIFQVLLEAAIPTYGYFFWEWDTSFILFFYALDWILFLILGYFKLRKRVSYSGDETELKNGINYLLLSGITLVLTSLIMLFTLPLIEPTHYSWKERLISFLSYTDMGIQQGFVIIPLVVLAGILTYKQQFILTAAYRKLTGMNITKPILVQSVLIFSFAFLAFMCAVNFVYPAVVLLFAVIVGTTGYKLLNTIKRT